MVVVVGAGWAGCAAAYAAATAGAKVTLIEKTDMLLGTGLVGGIMRNNGRYTATGEACALGCSDIFNIIESVTRHRWLDFPGHRHASLYDVTKIESVIKKALMEKGIDLRLQNRVIGAFKKGNKLTEVYTAQGKNFAGEIFIDATGTAGPIRNCTQLGLGCAMCILRCPTFGPRVSLTDKAGIKEIKAGEGFPYFEAMSGSCKLDKKSLAPWLVLQLEKNGVVVSPLPPDIQNEIQKKESTQPKAKACQQYNLVEYTKNLILLDTGQAKLMTPFFPLEILRKIKGFEEARYADPYSGGKGNSVRFMAIAPCDDSLKVEGVSNLYCAGEKTGLLVGHTEAIITGFLAGYNAVCRLAGKEPLVLSTELAAGDLIYFMHQEMKTQEGMKKKYTFSGSVYFERMLDLNLYTTDLKNIERRVAKTGLKGIFKSKIL